MVLPSGGRKTGVARKPGDLSLEQADTLYYRAPVVDGLIEAQVAGINARHPSWPLVSGNRVSAITHGAGLRRDTLANVPMGANQLRSSLIYLPETATFDSVGLTIGTGDGNVRLGVGTYDFANRTATLITDFGELNVSTSGNKTLAINETLGPGWIILLAWFSAAPTVAGGEPATGYDMNSNGNPLATPLRTGGTYGALPSTITFNTDSTTILSMWLEVA